MISENDQLPWNIDPSMVLALELPSVNMGAQSGVGAHKITLEPLVDQVDPRNATWHLTGCGRSVGPSEIRSAC